MRFDDPWDPDDPAIRRMRDVEAAIVARVTAQDAPRRQKATEADAGSCDPQSTLPEASKAARVSALIARVRAGDLSAIDALRRLIG